MAVQEYIGWATGVNKVIIDSTNITVGDNALRTDELESGHKRSVQKGPFSPDKYNVNMVFNWVDEVVLHRYDNQGHIIEDIHTGKTEYQLFIEWYRYRHKYGSVPFEFPKILYSQNTGITVLDNAAVRTEFFYGNVQVEYYKITSAVSSEKSGNEIAVNMTWETVYGGEVSIETPLPAVAGISAKRTYVDIIFSRVSDTAPVSQQFTVYRGDSVLAKTGFNYDGTDTVRIYYDSISVGSSVSIAISNYSGYSESKGTHTSVVG